MRKNNYLVTGVKYIDGEPQLAGEGAVVVAASEEQAIRLFLEERETGDNIVWEVSAQEDISLDP